MKSSLFTALILATQSAFAQSPLTSFTSEPSIESVQHAAERTAELAPERIRSWLRRVNLAALLPQLKVRVGRGASGVQIVRGLDGIDRFDTTATDSWRFEVETDWSLDRLLFDRNELRLSREATRLSSRREELLTRVTQLYFARRRLQLEELLAKQDPESAEPSRDANAAIDRQLAVDELTALLNGLTGGIFSKSSANGR